MKDTEERKFNSREDECRKCLVNRGCPALQISLSGEKLSLIIGPFPGGTSGNPPASAGDIRDASSIPRLGRSPEGGHGNPTLVFLPGESLWTEEPGGLQSMGSQGVGHD